MIGRCVSKSGVRTFLLAAIVMLAAVAASLPAEAQAIGLDNLQRKEILRIRVVAHSDEPDEQQLKQRLVLRTLAVLQPQLQEVDCVKEAKRVVDEQLNHLTAKLRSVVNDAGLSHDLQVTLAAEFAPQTSYGRRQLPEGIYPTVRIEVGEGEGQNWWCVLYPSLCLQYVGRDQLLPIGFPGGQNVDEEQIKIRWAAKEIVLRLLQPRDRVTDASKKLLIIQQDRRVSLGKSLEVVPTRLYE